MRTCVTIFWIASITIAMVGCSDSTAESKVAKAGGKESESSTARTEDPPNTIKDQTVEVSCGQCQLGLKGNGCDLAVRIDGKSYFVDGSSIDDHGDAHGADGLCNCVRQAQVTGEIKEGRFVATSIVVLPSDAGKSHTK